MDYSLPDINGLLAAQRIIASSPQTAVLVVSMHADEGHIARALRIGAREGIVHQSDAGHEIAGHLYGLRAVAGFTDHNKIILILYDAAEPAAD